MDSEASTASNARLCLSGLTNLCAMTQSSECRYKEQISPPVVQDDTHRFKVWAENIGALQDSQYRSSLDYRLRDAPHVKVQVTRMLYRLLDNIKQASEICNGSRPNRTEDDSEVELYGSSDPSEALRNPRSEIQEHLGAISGGITRLFKLSMMIRQAAPKDRYTRVASLQPHDSLYDINYIWEKFPKARSLEWLIERLGKANTRRRDFFLYRTKHKERLAKDMQSRTARQIDHAQEYQPRIGRERRPESYAESSLLETKASTFVPQAEPPTMPNVDDIDNTSDSGVSATSYVTSAADDIQTPLRVPSPPPPFHENLPFECPYCFTIQSPRDRRTWKQHVFRDLQPYICTHSSCGLQMFTDRHTWFAHEMQVHSKEWACNMCKDHRSQSMEEFEQHILNHKQNLTSQQLPTIISLCEEQVEKFNPFDCPLCDEWWQKLNDQEITADPSKKDQIIVVKPLEFRRHVGRHLEHISLFSLPRDLALDEGSDLGSHIALVARTHSDDSLDSLDFGESDDEPVEQGEQDHILYKAAVSGDHQKVWELLLDGSDANARGAGYGCALQAAVYLGFLDIVIILVQYNADVNAPPGPQGTAIQAAAYQGDLHVVRKLLEAGADVNAPPGPQGTAIQAAAYQGSLYVVHMLLEAGADVNAPPGPQGTAIQAAALQGHQHVVDLLLLFGASNNSMPRQEDKPSTELCQLLRRIAQFILTNFEPPTLVVTPQKMQRFYKETHIKSEIWPWEDVFDDKTSSISRLFRDLFVEHHLIQEGDLKERPDLPGLTEHGFETLLMLFIRAYPDQEYERLIMAAKVFPIITPNNQRDWFPSVIPRTLLPEDQDKGIRNMLSHMIGKHCGVDELHS